MAYKLTAFPERAKYSLFERQLFEMLPQKGKGIGNRELAVQRLKQGPWDVKHPYHIIATVMPRLVKKVLLNNEPFIIECDEGSRGAVSYSIKRKPVTHPPSPSGTTRSLLLD
jgi:hypothetical protein